MNLRSSHLANQGARLARTINRGGAPRAREAASQAPDGLVLTPKAPDGASATADDARSGSRPAAEERASRAAAPNAAGRELPASGNRFELTLSDRVQAILHLAAGAAGVSHGEFVARAICAYAAEAVGFPGLSDELHTAPAPARAGASRFDGFMTDHAGVPP